jgi:hypothetical protein
MSISGSVLGDPGILFKTYIKKQVVLEKEMRADSKISFVDCISTLNRSRAALI